MFFFIASCSKNMENGLTPVVEKNRIDLKGHGNRFPESRVSLQQFFNSYDTSILNRLRYSGFSEVSLFSINPMLSSDLEYIYSKNIELISLLHQINPSLYDPFAMNPSDELILYVGIIELHNELNMTTNSDGRAQFSFQCIRDIIEGIFTVGGVIRAYNTMVASGAGWGTIRTFLWQMLKRYGGWALAAGVLYDIVTTCR
jgi:hypothetical protein